MAGVHGVRSRHSLYQGEDQDRGEADGELYPVFTTTTSFQPHNGSSHYRESDYANGGLRRSDSPNHYRNGYAEHQSRNRSSVAPYMAYSKPDNNERRVDSYFSFLNEPKPVPVEPGWEREQPVLRQKSVKRNEESLVNKVFAIIFCVVELLIGLGLISYGAVRTSRIKNSLTQPPPLQFNTTEASQTASSCMEVGLFLVFFSLVGIIGFSLALRAMKVAHLILGDMTAILAVYGILYGAAEIDDSYRFKLIDSNQFAADVTILILLATIIFLLILTTCTQATFGLFVHYYRRHRTWAASLTVFTVFLTIFATTLTVLGGIGLRNALENRPSISPITLNSPGLQTVFQYKRSIAISVICSGLWAWILSFFAIGSVFSKSRPVALSVAVLWVPSLYILMKVSLHGFATLIPTLSTSWYTTNGPKDPVAIFYAMCGFSFVTEIFLFACICFAAISVFRK